jgi:hypothetical protein
MKSNILRIKAFAVLVIIAVFFSAFNLKEKEKRTFLETYKGTLWKYGEPKDGLTIYAQINKSESEPFEIWLYNVLDDCYFFERYSESVATEVLENKKNKVQIKIKESSKEHGIFTLTINGSALHMELDSFKEGKLVKEEHFTLKKSNDKIDNIKVCKN